MDPKIWYMVECNLFAAAMRGRFKVSAVICKRKFGFRQIPECAILSLCYLVQRILQTEFSEMSVGNKKNQLH